MNRERSRMIHYWAIYNKERNATIMIQKNFRGHYARKVLIENFSKDYIKQANEKAIKIQAIWRMNVAMNKARELAISQIVTMSCDKAEEKVGNFLIMSNVIMNTKYCSFYRKVYRDLVNAATLIKSFMKMVPIRMQYLKILVYERTYSSIKWHGNANSVEVIGDFTKPQWKVKLRLDYCSFRGIFVKYLDRIESGITYEYSMILDGKLDPERHRWEIPKKFEPTIPEIDDYEDNKPGLMTFYSKPASEIEITPKKNFQTIIDPSKKFDLKQNNEIDIKERSEKDYASNQNDEMLTQTTDRDVLDTIRTNDGY